MSLMGFHRHKSGTPLVKPFNIAVSMTILKGDPVAGVQDTGNNLTYVRKSTAADVTAHFTQTQTKGFLGLAANDVTTDANGFASVNVGGYSGAGAGGAAMFPLPSYDAGIDPDPDTGRSRTRVIIADDDTEFWGYIKAADVTTIIDSRLVGRHMDLLLVGTTFVLDPAGDTAVVMVTGVDEQHPGYNLANAGTVGLGGRVFFKVNPTFQQYTNGNPWWTA